MGVVTMGSIANNQYTICNLPQIKKHIIDRGIDLGFGSKKRVTSRVRFHGYKLWRTTQKVSTHRTFLSSPSDKNTKPKNRQKWPK